MEGFAFLCLDRDECLVALAKCTNQFIKDGIRSGPEGCAITEFDLDSHDRRRPTISNLRLDGDNPSVMRIPQP